MISAESLKPHIEEEAFAFISYAGKDAELVRPIIEGMKQRGYRVWYDEGITPGVQWDENIASRVSACSCVIAVLSQSYFSSENCVDELKYSRDLEKPLVLLYLENLSLIGGMALRVGRHPKIYYDPNDGQEELFAALSRISTLDNCRAGASSYGTRLKKTAGGRKTIAMLLILAAVMLGIVAALLWSGDVEKGVAEPSPTMELFSPVQVFDNEHFTATVVDAGFDDAYYTLELEIVNKTTEKLFFSMEDGYLNGALCELDMWSEVEAEKTNTIILQWRAQELTVYEIDPAAITAVEGNLMYSLRAQGEMYTAFIAYYPWGEENADYVPCPENGGKIPVVYSDELFAVVGENWYGETDNEWYFELFLQNNTDQDMTVIVKVDNINGIRISKFPEYTVEAGRLRRVEVEYGAEEWMLGGNVQVFSGILESGSDETGWTQSERFAIFVQ